MGARGLLTAGERQRVVDAIRAAESGTSGEIRVHVERHCKGEPLDRARALFAEMGMTATKRRNGVLLYIASADHRFAIYGDEGIHREVGAAYWDAIRDRLAERFRDGAFCEGIREAVGRVGETLKASFPREADDVNELPDDTSFGE
jgi:uncharacterized membrane protein